MSICTATRSASKRRGWKNSEVQRVAGNLGLLADFGEAFPLTVPGVYSRRVLENNWSFDRRGSPLAYARAPWRVGRDLRGDSRAIPGHAPAPWTRDGSHAAAAVHPG